MYKVIQNLVIIVSISLLSIFTLWDILTFSKPLPGGVTESVYVSNSQIDLRNELEEIANDNKVLLAKQIIVPSGTPKSGFSGDYKFEKIGHGKLPSIYPEEKNKKIITNSNNDTNYLIVGSALTAKSLATQLEASGNTVIPTKTDTRFSPIQDLITTYRIPVLIILISFSTVLLAENVSKIKKDGIVRLAGVSKIRLAFSPIFQDIKIFLGIFIVFSGMGTLYLLFIKQLWLAYLQSMVFTLFFGILTFIFIDLILSLFLFYFLQKQKIDLSIKGKNPMAEIMILIIIFQTVAILSSMNSISNVMNANTQVGLLQQAQKSWRANKQYYAPTFMGQMMSVLQNNPEQLKGFLIDLLKQPDALFSSSNALTVSEDQKTWNESISRYTYPASGQPYVNVFYANAKLLSNEKIKLPSRAEDRISHLRTGEYAILVPESQTSNYHQLTQKWSQIESEISPYLTKEPIEAIYATPKSIFGFSVMKNQFNNYSSVPNPLIIVYGSKTFEKGLPGQIAVNTMAYLSNGQILVTNRAAVKTLFEKYGLQKYEGSFFNGYQAVSAKLTDAENQRNLLFGVNILCLLSSLLLTSLLNSIYLYQNRRKFLIERLSGKSWLDIHSVYLAIIVTLTALISAIARVWLHVPIEALIVPIIYLLLVFALFAVQVRHHREANGLYLKGF